jgi:hypothetical protein
MKRHVNQIQKLFFSQLARIYSRCLASTRWLSVFLQNNRVRLCVLQTEAKIKSSISCSEGLVVVTVLNRLYCSDIVSFLN